MHPATKECYSYIVKSITSQSVYFLRICLETGGTVLNYYPLPSSHSILSNVQSYIPERSHCRGHSGTNPSQSDACTSFQVIGLIAQISVCKCVITLFPGLLMTSSEPNVW